MIKRRRISEDIADSILDKVLEMGLKEGDRLPTHTQLSEYLGVSLPSLREGLSLLSLSGLINITHGSGTILTTPGPEDYFKILSSASRIHRVDLKELTDYCGLFIPDLVDVCIENKVSLEETLKSMAGADSAGGSDSFLRSHRQFHTQLASFIKNSLKRTSFQMALNMFYSHSAITGAQGVLSRNYSKSHNKLLEALESDHRQKVEEALLECYKFEILDEVRVSLVYDNFGTGSLGGSFYSMAKRFSNLFMNESGIKTHLELTGGGIENVDMMEKGRAILALTQLDVAEAAYTGNGLFSSAHTHLRIVCEVKPLNLWIVALKKSGITRLDDLKGQRIAMGAEGGDSGIVAGTILNILGINAGDYRSYYLSLSNAVQGLSSNEIDVVFFLAHEIPSGFKDLSESEELVYLQIPQEILSQLEMYNPFWKRVSVFPNSNDLGKIDTISVATVLITSSQVPEELISRLAIVLLENGDEEDHISFKGTETPISIPFHPGVIKCLK